MRSTLHIKFIALYIIFGFLCLFSTATLTEQLVTDKLTEDTSHTLYREATFVANDYLPSYFSGDSSIYNVQSQLSAMRLYFNASIWFVDSTGRTLTSSSLEDTVCPDRIKDFNPAEIGGNRYITGTYHGYFDEDMITVMGACDTRFFYKGIPSDPQSRLCHRREMRSDHDSGIHLHSSHFRTFSYLSPRRAVFHPSSAQADFRSGKTIRYRKS